MFKNLTLQNRLIGSFVFMGSLVLTVGFIGWKGSNQLSEHIHTLNKTSLPSIVGLWKINEGQTHVRSAERSLLNPQTSQENREVELAEIRTAWAQIDEGFRQYEPAPQTAEEKKFYEDTFLPAWNEWKHDHQNFLKLYEQLQADGLSKADFDKFNQFRAAESRLSFSAATEAMLKLLEINEQVASETVLAANQDVKQTNSWILLGIIFGPTTAIVAGIYFSITIAKPLAGRISGIVNSIASSSNEIVATVEQQERTATEQSTAVNQTTTAMDELGAASRQSADQAESAASIAQQVLVLVGGMTQGERDNRSSLLEKVRQIAEQILHLSEQTSQIGLISNLVSDLANQTNMLALNAAVEAVRAGEHGKGFSVVATEIRKLAEQSRKSAEKINGLVSDVQNATNSTVMVTDEGTKTVENIVGMINNIALNSQQISLTAKQQAIAIKQVVDSMNAINQGASQTAAGISQARVSVQRLNEAATTLKATV